MADDGYRFLSIPMADAKDYVVDKEKSSSEFATYFLARLMKMFKYDGLPEEIPQDCMNKMLLQDGFCWFTKWKSNTLVDEERDQFYVFHGRMGSVIDAYYRPTEIIISNPGANCYKNFTLNKQKGGTYYGDEGVIIRNDTLYHGLMPLIKRYAYLLAENILTMRTADVFLRIIALISAQDDKTYLSANEFIRSIEDGKMLAVSEGKFFEGVKMQSPPSNNGSYLTQFIEYQQYFLGSFFNEIGLNANFNMKRESIAKSESSLNEDSMLPLCQNMLMCRQQDFDVVNEMYGLNIKVSFDSAWLQNALEIMLELKNLNGANGLVGGINDKAADEGQGKEDVPEDTGAGNGDSTAEGEGVNEGSAGDGGVSENDESAGGDGDAGDGETGDGGGEAGASEEEGETQKEQLIEELIEEAAGLAETLNDEEEKKDESSEEDL